MLTYREYFNRMKAIEKAFNAFDNSHPAIINTTGKTARESFLAKAGFMLEVFSDKQWTALDNISYIVSILVGMCRSESGEFSFGVYPVEEAEEEDEIIDEWESRFISYSRMGHYTFLGTLFTLDPVYDFNESDDVVFWCSQIAEHIANYCVAHEINLQQMLEHPKYF